ncbi:MAG: hypothetical protein ACKOTA_11875 [Solirubrobacterales bacterium]
MTGDPPGQAARATAALASGEPLLLSDVVFAECVFVLESVYGVTRERLFGGEHRCGPRRLPRRVAGQVPDDDVGVQERSQRCFP